MKAPSQIRSRAQRGPSRRELTLTLRQLEIFQAVARREHVGEAATELFLSQSAVSHALAELGRALGGPLFDRHGRGLRLNERGRRLAEECEVVLDAASTLLERVLGSSGELRGSLRLGASTTIGNYLLPRSVGAFVARHPRGRVELEVGNSTQIERALHAQRVDLALIEGSPQHPESLRELWREDELCVVVAPGHALARRRRLAPRELAKLRWILRETGSGTREVFERALPSGLRLEAYLTFGNTEAIKQAVTAGLGVGCLSRATIERELESGSLVHLRVPQLELRRPLWLLRRSSGQPGRLASALREHLLSAAGGGSAAPASKAV